MSTGSEQPIRFDESLHAAGEQVNVPSHALRQAMAWWIASEMVRRHPLDLRVAEWHPMDGGYDCVSLFRRDPDGGQWNGWVDSVHLHKGEGSTHIAPSAWFATTSDERFNWLEILLSTDRRSYVVEQLERVEGFRSPGATPSTVAQSIGPLLISSFLARTALTQDKWLMMNGYGDTWGEQRDWLFAPFADADRLRGSRESEDLFAIPETRYWFITEAPPGYPDQNSVTAHVAIDVVNGLAWTSTRRWVLLEAYERVSRRLSSLVQEVLGHLE
jgi:hypothetical protein